MFGGTMLIFAVIVNFLMHLLGFQTMCQWWRAHVPKPLTPILLTGIFGWLVQHVWRGYPKE